MDADIKGSLKNINNLWQLFEHNGNRLSKIEVKKVLEYGLAMGYTAVSQITDKEIEMVLKNQK